jgi:hypothetical protein
MVRPDVPLAYPLFLSQQVGFFFLTRTSGFHELNLLIFQDDVQGVNDSRNISKNCE